MAYSAILFDLDGTLIDSLPGIEYAVDYALAQMRLAPRTRSLRSLIGPPIREIFKQIVPNPSEDQLAGLQAAFRSCYDGDGWRRTVLHANASSTVKTLYQADIALYIATNKPALPTRVILDELGLASYFTGVVSRDSRQPPFSSKAEMLRSIVAEHRLNPETCLYVGDTLEDYESGIAAGISVALVPHGYGSFETRGLPPSCLPLADLADLLQFAERVEIS